MRASNKWLVVIIFLSLGLSLMPLATACRGESSSKTVLSVSQGEVLVQKSGKNDWVKGAAGMVINAGDQIKAGPAAKSVITFFDGSTIELEADTQIEITELTGGKNQAIRLKQKIGVTISTVKKLTDPAWRYEIETPAAVAGVGGSSMLVRVEPDGRTTVHNRMGNIYVKAQGVETLIPVGNASTVMPGEAPSAPQPVSQPQSYSDPPDDIFDSKGNRVSGEAYQDILGASLVKDNIFWVLTISLKGDVPQAVGDTIFMEFNLMIDSDNNAKTGWSTPLYFNDIGADYYLNIFLDGARSGGGGFLTADTAGSRFTDVQYKINGKSVELKFPAERIGNSENFRYIVLTRKYSRATTPNILLGADKLPDQGHLTAGK